MQVNIIAKNFEITPSIKEYCIKKIQRAKKYFSEGVQGHVTLSLEKTGHLAECFLNLPQKKGIHLKARGVDVYSAIDILTDHLDEKLRRIKEKMKDTKRKRIRNKELNKAYLSVFSQDNLAEVSKKYIKIEQMSFKDAVDKMEKEGYRFWIYLEPVSRVLQIVYKRENGGYGLIEPLTEEEEE